MFWYNAAPEAKKIKLDEPISKIKRSLDFLSTAREGEQVGTPLHVSDLSET